MNGTEAVMNSLTTAKIIVREMIDEYPQSFDLLNEIVRRLEVKQQEYWKLLNSLCDCCRRNKWTHRQHNKKDGFLAQENKYCNDCYKELL